MTIRLELTLLAVVLLLYGCTHARPTSSAFELASHTFRAESVLPDSTVLNGLDCNGSNESPQLHWSGAPAGTQSFALILDDYEARYGDGFIHWVAFNIPATTTQLAVNAGATEPDLAGGGKHAYNDFLRRRYDGPCPPEGAPHRYRFTIYALDLPSIAEAGTPMTWRKLRAIMHRHVLGQASLTGLRGHSTGARSDWKRQGSKQIELIGSLR